VPLTKIFPGSFPVIISGAYYGDLKMKLRTEKTSYPVKIVRGAEVGNFTVCPMTPREESTLLKKHTSVPRGRHGVAGEKEVNFIELQIDRVDHVITGWDIKDEKNKKLECTTANKEMIYLYNPSLIAEVMEQAAEIGQGEIEDEAEDVKN